MRRSGNARACTNLLTAKDHIMVWSDLRVSSIFNEIRRVSRDLNQDSRRREGLDPAGDGSSENAMYIPGALPRSQLN